MKMTQKHSKGIVPGVILIGLGILFFLNNYNIDIGDWFILGIGIVFLVAYITKKKTGFLVTGLILSYFGGLIFLENLDFINGHLFGALFLTALGAAFLTVYFIKKKLGFIFPGFILLAVGIYAVVTKVADVGQRELWPLIFMLLAIAFLSIFALEFRRLGYRPLIPALILFVAGVLAFMTTGGIITPDGWFDFLRMLSRFWPLLLIIAGVSIIFKNSGRQK